MAEQGMIPWFRIVNPDNPAELIIPVGLSDRLWELRKTLPIDFIQLWSVSLTQSGTYPTGDGYSVRELRMFDGTAYGGQQSLMRLVSGLLANGILSSVDLVSHQMDTVHTVYPNNRRGAQTYGWFRGETNPITQDGKFVGWRDPIPPFSPRDPVPSPSDDFTFGEEKVYRNCKPANASVEDFLDFAHMLFELLGVPWARLDDMKGTWVGLVREMVAAFPDTSFMAEFFDTNPANLLPWQASVGGKVLLEDFQGKYQIQNACNNYDATLLDAGEQSLSAINSDIAVGMLDNPDTDMTPGSQTISNKGLGYVVLFTRPYARVLVAGKDYWPDKTFLGGYGLKPILDPILCAAKQFAIGKYSVLWQDRNVWVGMRDGDGGELGWSPGLVSAVNFDTQSGHNVYVQTIFAEGDVLEDYLGHVWNITVSVGGWIEIKLPPNTNSAGVSSCMLSKAGNRNSYPHIPQPITQTFWFAEDLVLGKIKNGRIKLPYQLYCAKHTKVSVRFLGDVAKGTLIFTVVDAGGNFAAGHSIIDGGAGTTLNLLATEEGWVTVYCDASDLPAPIDGKLAVTYTGA